MCSYVVISASSWVTVKEIFEICDQSPISIHVSTEVPQESKENAGNLLFNTRLDIQSKVVKNMSNCTELKGED